MAGAAIANEIRAIAAGLAGKKEVKFVQVKDLMLDTGVSSSHGSKLRDTRDIDTDRAAAENYYKAWSRSIKTKTKEIEEGKVKSASPESKSKSKPESNSKAKSRPKPTRNSPRRP